MAQQPKRSKPITKSNKGGGATPSSDPTDTAKFEKQIVAESNKREAPTFIKGKSISSNLEGRSYFDNWLFYRDRDSDEDPIIISGNDAQIALQASLLKAIDRLLDLRGENADFDFEKWVEHFENGFSSFTVGASQELTVQWNKKEPWPGIKTLNRPKIVELKQKSATADFKVIQFFPDRSNKSVFYLFSGSTYKEIAWQIINWWNQKTTEAGEVTAGGKKFTPTMVGQPLIIIRFFNTTTRTEGKKIIRIMSKTDDPFSTLPKISNNDIKQYANRILEQFNGYIWKKGKEVTSYKGKVPKQQGLDGWAYRTSETVGIDLFTRLATAAGVELDRRYLKHSQTEDETAAYPSTPQKAVILGKERDLPLQRPVVDVKFTSAHIRLNSLGQEATLVQNGKVTFADL